MQRLPHAKIVEREPKPGDIPVEQFPNVVGQAKNLVIPAQTLMNGSLECILRLSQTVPSKILLGPSAPLAPVWLDHGFTQICTSVVVDADAVERFISETDTMIMMDHLVKQVCIGKKQVED